MPSVGDGDGQGVLGDGDLGIQGVAAGVHQVAVLVQAERAVPGVGEGAVGLQHPEEALALDGHVELGVGLLQAAGAEVLDHGRHPGAVPQLQAGGLGGGGGGVGAGGVDGLVEQVLEFGPGALEPGVLMLARLLEMVSMFMVCTFIPAAADHMALIMAGSCY